LEYAIHGFDESGKYTSPEQLIATFPDEDKLAQDIIKYYGSLQDADRTFETEFIHHNKKYVRLMLMGMLSTAQFGHDSWYKIMNESDPVVRKALEVIKADRKITLKY
jgi:hypothetical protein